MPQPLQIGLIGDFDPSVTAHQAIPRAIAFAADALDQAVEPHWLATELIGDPKTLMSFDGFWCVPASPYRSTDGALAAIRFARETGRPFLGTCGGFQHAILEFARNRLGWSDAGHDETTPGAGRRVITMLACSLVEVSNTIRFQPGSTIAKAYDRLQAQEEYHCRFGLNPDFERELTGGPLRAIAWDDSGEVRAVELEDHPFYLATLFQPERAALRNIIPPLVRAFIEAVALAPRASS